MCILPLNLHVNKKSDDDDDDDDDDTNKDDHYVVKIAKNENNTCRTTNLIFVQSRYEQFFHRILSSVYELSKMVMVFKQDLSQGQDSSPDTPLPIT